MNSGYRDSKRHCVRTPKAEEGIFLGDYLVQCDYSGEKCLRSQCVKQWNNFIVKREYADKRHPLDFQKPPKPARPVREARPQNGYFLEYGDVKPEDL